MAVAHLAAAAPRLQVLQAGAQGVEAQGHAASLAIEAGLEQAGEQAIERMRLPVAVHVGLAEAQRALRGDTREQARVAHLQVPGPRSVDANVRASQQGLDPALQQAGAGEGGRVAGLHGGLRSTGGIPARIIARPGFICLNAWIREAPPRRDFRPCPAGAGGFTVSGVDGGDAATAHNRGNTT